ncbi:hypothetical protein HY546_03305, partial [archaeon]|nr:hypothetical protein [archaeon]
VHVKLLSEGTANPNRPTFDTDSIFTFCFESDANGHDGVLLVDPLIRNDFCFDVKGSQNSEQTPFRFYRWLNGWVDITARYTSSAESVKVAARRSSNSELQIEFKVPLIELKNALGKSVGFAFFEQFSYSVTGEMSGGAKRVTLIPKHIYPRAQDPSGNLILTDITDPKTWADLQLSGAVQSGVGPGEPPTPALPAVGPKAFYRDLPANRHESSQGILEGVKEGDLVAFVPDGDVAGRKVEWFDEWNGKRYKLAFPELVKELSFGSDPTLRLEAFSDAEMTVPLSRAQPGDAVHFRAAVLNPATGEPVTQEYWQRAGTDQQVYRLVAFYKTADAEDKILGRTLGSPIVYSGSLTLPQNYSPGGTLTMTLSEINSGELSVKLELDGSRSSAERTGTLKMEKPEAFGVDDLAEVTKNNGIYRSFAIGSHRIIMFVGSIESGSVVLDVAPVQATQSKKVGIVLTRYDGLKPDACGDGRDRDGDGFTGYGKDDDCDGWDAYEYNNLIFSRVNKFYSEASDGRIRFDWRIFDNNGSWVYVKAPLIEGAGGWSVTAVTQEAIFRATGDHSWKAREDAFVLVIVPRATPNSFLFASGVTTFSRDMIVYETTPTVTFIHELGHALSRTTTELYPRFGLPTESDIRQWGAMHVLMPFSDDLPPLMDAYTRLNTGWATEDLKIQDGTFTIGLGYKSHNVLTLRLMPVLSYIAGAKYLVEGRSRSRHLSYFDRGAPDTAVVVYEVNSLANGLFDQVGVITSMKTVGDKVDTLIGDIELGSIELVSNDLLVKGTAEVRVTAGGFNDLIGAVVDGVGQVSEAIGEAAEALADSAGAAADVVSDFLNGLFGGSSGSASNETLDLDLHAFYTLGGVKYHVGLDYETGEYEKPTGVVASGNRLGGEFIFVPSSAQGVEFRVSNSKLRDFFAKHAEVGPRSKGDKKFSVVFIKYDTQGKRTVTDPIRGALSLEEREESFTPLAQGFAEKQSVTRATPETARGRLLVLRDVKSYEIAYSQEFIGKAVPKPPKSVYSSSGDYVVLLQSAGPDNELYINDNLLEQDVLRFEDEARKQKDNSFRKLQLRVEPAGSALGPSPAAGAGFDSLVLLVTGGSLFAVILVVLFFVVRARRPA